MTRAHLEWFARALPGVKTHALQIWGNPDDASKMILGWSMGAYYAFFESNDYICQIELAAVVNTVEMLGKINGKSGPN